MISELGEEYSLSLRKAWSIVPGGADLVCYWFAKAWTMMCAGQVQRVGLVATNSIRGGANREVLKPIVERGRIFEAWNDEDWTVDGAAVRVSLVSFDNKNAGSAVLNGQEVFKVLADLSPQIGGTNLTLSSRLAANRSVAFQGPVKIGPFDVEGTIARSWLRLPVNPNGKGNAEVVRLLLNGMDITRRTSDRWIIDFGTMSGDQAALFEAPFENVLANVKPLRDKNRRERRKIYWWQHGETVPGIKKAILSRNRAIFSPRVAKYRLFVWASSHVVPDSAVVVIARDDDTCFGILHSTFHELWSLRMGTSLEDRPRYTPSTTFETFPFPEGLTPDIDAANYADDPRAIAIAKAAARLNELRDNWLNPADLVIREPEVVPSYPDRILPKDEAAAKELSKRTLTNLYNARPAWLDNAHGWGDDWRSGMLTEDEILARLFRLNQERASAT